MHWVPIIIRISYVSCRLTAPISPLLLSPWLSAWHSGTRPQPPLPPRGGWEPPGPSRPQASPSMLGKRLCQLPGQAQVALQCPRAWSGHTAAEATVPHLLPGARNPRALFPPPPCSASWLAQPQLAGACQSAQLTNQEARWSKAHPPQEWKPMDRPRRLERGAGWGGAGWESWRGVGVGGGALGVKVVAVGLRRLLVVLDKVRMVTSILKWDCDAYKW